MNVQNYIISFRLNLQRTKIKVTFVDIQTNFHPQMKKIKKINKKKYKKTHFNYKILYVKEQAQQIEALSITSLI